jgi:hypothetical protein
MNVELGDLPMDDEQFDDMIRQTLTESRRPPEPPLDEMWAQIESRAFGPAASGTAVHAFQSRWRMPALAAAAALLAGVGLGWSIAPQRTITRIVSAPIQTGAIQRQPDARAVQTAPGDVRAGTAMVRNVPPAPTPAGPVDAESGLPHSGAGAARLPAQFNDVGNGSEMGRYLAQTSLLLASLPSDRSGAASDTALAARASDLLTQTHLLLDSRAGSDPTLHRLLEDLELVLAQVSRLRGTRNASDLQLIHQALATHDVLPRVHDATVEASITD